MKLDYPSLKPKKADPRLAKNGEDYLRSKWGRNFEPRVAKARVLLDLFGTEEFIQYLNDTGLGSFAPMVEGLYQAALDYENKANKGKSTTQ